MFEDNLISSQPLRNYLLDSQVYWGRSARIVVSHNLAVHLLTTIVRVFAIINATEGKVLYPRGAAGAKLSSYPRIVQQDLVEKATRDSFPSIVVQMIIGRSAGDDALCR
jgi:hypothetical protein